MSALHEAADDGWRPIEIAPKDGELVDLWCPGQSVPRRVADAFYDRGRGGWIFFACASMGFVRVADEAGEPTHWRRRPRPPETEARR
jgi:hypothetical protein